ncbi:MAG: hypothetical protein [Bacteriophage sp.]|nr:MAG: hypothetical protein [Bacteriophage sp.]
MNAVLWFLYRRWVFKFKVKRYDIDISADALVRNNLFGSRYNEFIMRDLIRILNKSPN